MERHEWKDKAGMPWTVGEAEDGEPDFVEVASYGLVRRSRAAIGAEILRLAALVRQDEHDWRAMLALIATSFGDEETRGAVEGDPDFYGTFDPWKCIRNAAAERDALRSERDEAMELVRRLGSAAPRFAAEAPCLLCGYKGMGYWQIGTHPTSCPVHGIGGIDDRQEFYRARIATREGS